MYINRNWKDRSVVDSWRSVQKGDTVLVYCTGTVEPYPSQLSYIMTVDQVELSDEKAILRFGESTELRQPMTREEILERIESGEFSEGMRGCGRQGFNFCRVTESDLEIVLKWSESKEVKEGIEVDRESLLNKYLVKFPDKIEAGLKIIEPSDVLPEGAGIPDIVCKDGNGNYVVVELKSGEASYDALGQIASYKGAIMRKVKGKVRGIIVASTFDPKILFGAEITDPYGIRLAELKKYTVDFTIEDALREH